MKFVNLHFITKHYSSFFIQVAIVILVLAGQTLTRAADYILGPGDVIKVTVYDNDDLLTLTRISDDGFIIMPLLGQVKVQDLTVSSASEHIARLLADGYIINPQVNIFVQEFRSKKVIILGQINKPGLIEMSGPASFLEIISKAGGLADDFGETATIKRKNDGEDDVITVDLRSLVEGGDLNQNIPVRDGDTIYISKAGMCYVTGEVTTPNAYRCGDKITVLKLITLAGGFTGKAARSKVRLVRIVKGEKIMFENVEMDTPVQPDDVIIIPESFF